MKVTHTHECAACATPLAFPEDEFCDLCSDELQQHWQDRQLQEQAQQEADAFLAQYDDDPNPYHGTYSEE